MKITCLHGYFIIRETAIGGIAKFNSLYGQDLVARDDYYTFQPISEAPEYSIAGRPYLNLIATATFSGHPWEVFEANGFVYDFNLGILVLSASVTTKADFTRGYTSYIAKGLIIPGSLTPDYQEITGYQGAFDLSSFNYYYSEFFYGEN